MVVAFSTLMQWDEGSRNRSSCARLHARARSSAWGRLALALLLLTAPALVHCSSNDGDSATSGAQGSENGPGATDNNDPSTNAPGASSASGDDGSSSAPPTPAMDGGGPSTDGSAINNTAAFFGAARCGSAGVVLCDSFEGTEIDTAKWVVEKNGQNTIGIDPQHHARGGKSVRIHLVGATNFQYAWLSTTKVSPKLEDHVFGRMFYMVEKLPTKNMHWTTIEIDGPLAATGTNARLRYGGEYDRFMANYVTSGEMGQFSKTDVPIGKWTCLEWEYARAQNTMRLWIDEAPLTDLEVTNPAWVHPTDYKKLYIGWQNYQPNLVVPMNVWIDEVALDSTRIGCTK